MKITRFLVTRFLVLTVAFAPMAVMAGTLDELLGAALKTAAEDMRGGGQQQAAPTAQKAQGACEGRQFGEAASAAHSSLYGIDPQKTSTVEAFCSALRANSSQDDVQCYANCESRYRDEFAQVKSDREQRALAEKEESDRRLAVQQEEERKAMLEKQKAITREADLRAGRVKPQNFGEVAIVHNAEIGIDLASAPKVRPDGKMYALPGKIAIADDSPEFLAQISLGEQNDALFRMAGRSSEIDGRYFYVKIPKALQAYYFDQAKIERGFNMVGRYVANTKYKTIAGQQKSAPVFEAVYFVMR